VSRVCVQSMCVCVRAMILLQTVDEDLKLKCGGSVFGCSVAVF
jgi:hypothetical protein